MSGRLFVISGPSGVGKGTLVSRLLGSLGGLWLSVSATTRSPREGEVEGVHYFFISEERFDELVAEGGFLEWAVVHKDKRYGTLKSAVEAHCAAGEDVILEIDQQGAFQVKERCPEAILIFIAPPSEDELLRRLQGRGTETADEIARRMETAKVEFSLRERYNVQIVNDDLETATAELRACIESYRGHARR